MSMTPERLAGIKENSNDNVYASNDVVRELLDHVASLESELTRLREENQELSRRHANQAKSLQNYSDAITRAGYDPCLFSRAVDKMAADLTARTTNAATPQKG